MINDTNQVQEAGDNALQIQAQIVNIVNQSGIDEKRAREIFSDMFAVAKRDFAIEAENKAYERVQKLEDRLMPKMYRIEGALENFADPSFQSFLAKANRTAICTDRESDYDLLSELLIHRIEKKDSRKDKIGLNRAIEIVDQITDEALSALTVFFAIERFAPNARTLEKGMTILNDLYGKLPIENLPKDNDWLDELDILDAIRQHASFSTLKKFDEYWFDLFPGIFAVGIKNDSNEWIQSCQLLESCQLSKNLFIENKLMKGYVLIPVSNEKCIDDLLMVRKLDEHATMRIPFTDEQKNILHQIYNMYEKSSDLKEKIKKSFEKFIETYENIRVVRCWWNSIPHALDITPVGRVLAHANAKKCEPSLPDLN